MSFVRPRLPLAGVLVAGVLLVGICLATLGWDRGWRVWNVQVAVQPFLDSQVIAAGASSWREGHDPLRFNPHDIGHRPMNYPRVWQTLFRLGFKQEHAEVLGWALAALLLVGVWIALPPLRWSEAVFVGLAVFSPAVLLGVERGNTDLAVFFVLAVAVALPRTAWNTTWVAVAFALKLFPLAGIVVLFGRPRREAWLAAAALAVFAAIYVLGNLEDLRLISAATPRDAWLSYGMNVVPLRVASLSPWAGPVALALALAAVGSAVISGWRARVAAGGPLLVGGDADAVAALDAFRIGAACYAGTFLLGNNFIYRLVFLLFALPQLLRWVRRGSTCRRAAAVALAAVLLSLWTLGFDRESWVVRRDEWRWFVMGQAANWTAFVVLSGLFIRSLPAWRDGPRTRV